MKQTGAIHSLVHVCKCLPPTLADWWECKTDTELCATMLKQPADIPHKG